MPEAPLIFDIKRSSFSDGPGLRTVVFLKGCNLDCFWCHNPEGKNAASQHAFFEEKCQGCGACQQADARCPHDARKTFGKAYSKEELLEIILADQPYYMATGGGVTFSGGECLLYPDFVAQLAAACKAEGIAVAVDTAGDVPFSHFGAVLPYTDLFLYDIKALDPALHQRGTGRGNDRILENLARLQAANCNILIRIPCIPDFNEGTEVERIVSYCAARNLPYEILPYH
ncbi:MAG: radical SAM protein, partial [Clostridia bacterium]|nr:radical SAM protein [Clostridia bacterium]